MINWENEWNGVGWSRGIKCDGLDDVQVLTQIIPGLNYLQYLSITDH